MGCRIWHFNCEQLLVDLEKFGVSYQELLNDVTKDVDAYFKFQGEAYLSRLKENSRAAIRLLNIR
jgi:hypothetical protein